MGIFGALTTAVTGLRAQAYALENVSGNIANSQTTAFKRIDTSFEDLIPDSAVTQQLAGSVIGMSRSTNTVRGDVQAASVGTFMAVNGDGFLVVTKPTSFNNGTPSFDDSQQYTRRGDFQPDKNGYLVNGAGYYLKGIPIDPVTGLATASTPQLLQFQNSFIPAQATSRIDYHANLARGATVLDQSKFSSNPVFGAPVSSKITGKGATLSPDSPAIVTGTANASALSSAGGTLVINGTNITINPADDLTAVKAAINGAGAGVTASDDGNGHLVLTGPDAKTQTIIGGASSANILTELGLSAGTTDPVNLITQGAAAATQTLTVQFGAGAVQTLTFGPGNIETMADLSTALATITGGTASLNTTNGNVTFAALNNVDTITVGGTATPSKFGLSVTTAQPANGGNIIASDNTAFLANSLDGGAIAAHDVSGAAVNVHFRWAKVDSIASGGSDTWNLYYENNSAATGTQTQWLNAGVNYTFGANGQPNPPITSTVLNNLTVDGTNLGTVTVAFGANGLTQFTDTNGVVKVNQVQENSVAAGELQSVSVNDKGNIVGSYSNGQTLIVADVSLANFAGANNLKRIDGGAFEATDSSGSPIYGASGNIVGQSLEGSNTDIADEFTKLIITQQAYSANTRVITTSNQMVQDLLNTLR
jgi:flagellar hook protein FlgE